MKLLSIILVLSSVGRRAELQTTSQLRNSQDRIYFADMNWRIQVMDRVTTEKSDVEVQKSVDYKGQVDQNFLQAIPTPGYPTTVKENVNVRSELQRIYLHLQPGLFVNDPYFYGNRFNDNIAAFRPPGPVSLHNQALAQSQPPQAQPQLQPQKGQSQVFNQQAQPVRPSNSQSPDMQQNSQSSEPNGHVTGQNVQIPAQNVQIPGENVQIPGQNVQIPGQNVQISGQNVQMPGQNVQMPGQNVQVPGQNVHIPGQNVQIPGQYGQIPLQTQATQIPEGNAPVSRAVTGFGLNLLRSIRSSSNVVVSPFSIVSLLALLQQGALGETQKQITTALYMTPEYSAGAFRTFLDDIQKRTSRNILKVASNVFIADAFDLNKTFKSIALRQFGTDVTSIKFYRSDAVDKINHWVSAETNNKIERMLTPGAVGENTQVVLVNAVYFKGLWATKFRAEATSPREFRYSDGSARPVPFMHTKRAFRTGYDNELGTQVLILPFENEQYSLMIILPSTASTLDALLSKLTDERLIQYTAFSARDVDVKLPKFTARLDIDLDPVFRMMGITKIFGYQSELSGVGMYRTNSPQVSAGIHSAMLSIDEEGGTAAAATVVSAVALSYDHETVLSFNANRPFLAVLWDNQASLPLFMAKVEDPTE